MSALYTGTCKKEKGRGNNVLPLASLTKLYGTFCPTSSRNVSTVVKAVTSAAPYAANPLCSAIKPGSPFREADRSAKSKNTFRKFAEPRDPNSRTSIPTSVLFSGLNALTTRNGEPAPASAPFELTVRAPLDALEAGEWFDKEILARMPGAS
ncbi:hypothetical protein CHGG_07033 [Chaetomium globosum CBS 148.51]|uniref:Uncharacterized protein n=1 Tax=Chaetomium globosum (strain ATCC 6205 / CBS 148.51 / DSM 1962 / NBRC 6347 / NRRL 1970) TaxID=306901 RepID=Q2GYC1_CHAGB|nr:uncharacterized protein CHGG_07033 [Chaetomium globosum CBS 148.51]EAQ85780.1 hypothetical protein CHGG_07033 [Chaetomium globosum CBS 148.51]